MVQAFQKSIHACVCASGCGHVDQIDVDPASNS